MSAPKKKKAPKHSVGGSKDQIKIIASPALDMLELAVSLCEREGVADAHKKILRSWNVKHNLNQIYSLTNDSEFMQRTFKPVFELALQNCLECAIFNRIYDKILAEKPVSPEKQYKAIWGEDICFLRHRARFNKQERGRYNAWMALETKAMKDRQKKIDTICEAYCKTFHDQTLSEVLIPATPEG